MNSAAAISLVREKKGEIYIGKTFRDAEGMKNT